jgi:predicted site-specific integrase-resolvase
LTFLKTCSPNSAVKYVVVNKAEDMSPAQELTEDLISIVQHFAAKLYGQRTYKARKLTKTVREALAGAADGKTKEPAAEQ